MADEFRYWTGNPSVEIATGVIRFAETSSDVPGGAVALFASEVPNCMPPAEFCSFFAPEIFQQARVLHGISTDQYLMLLLVADHATALAAIAEYDGKLYNQLEGNVCHLHVVKTLTYAVDGEDLSQDGYKPSPLRAQRGASPPSASPIASSPSCSPLPSPRPSMNVVDIDTFFKDVGATGQCAVCLESLESANLTEIGGGYPLTVLCGHTFHWKCLERWCDSSCPVCRYQQHPYRSSSCEQCGSTDGLHICLLCGHIACAEQGNDSGLGVGDLSSHAEQHFELTQHAYAMEMATQRVWDYAGGGYVHRLMLNNSDGKMVEVSAQGSNEMARTAPSKKAEDIILEFNHLLSGQLDDQRIFYEELCTKKYEAFEEVLQPLQAQLEQEEASADKAAQALAQAEGELAEAVEKLQAEQAAEAKMRNQLAALEKLNNEISSEQSVFHSEKSLQQSREKERKLQVQREVEELKVQIRDLKSHLSMQRQSEAAGVSSGYVVITESERRKR